MFDSRFALASETSRRNSTWHARTSWYCLVVAATLAATLNTRPAMAGPMPLRVDPSGRYLESADGPFFWLGDTAWEMASDLGRRDVDRFMADRSSRGFTVVALVNAIPWDYRTRNVYGDQAIDASGSPIVVPGGSPASPNDWWDHLEYIIDSAASHGLYVELVPMNADTYINRTSSSLSNPAFHTAVQGRAYGEFIGARFRDKTNLIWALGGDTSPDRREGDMTPVYHAMAEGICHGVTGRSVRFDTPDSGWDDVVMTYHGRDPTDAMQPASSSIWFHSEPWYDFDGVYTGHRMTPGPDGIYAAIQFDRALDPVKPAIELEPKYEGGTASFSVGSPLLMRQQAYQAQLSGASGYTYGAFGLWSFDPGWTSLLAAPGAQGMTLFSELLHGASLWSGRWWTLIPDAGIVVGDPGTGIERKVGARTARGDEALVYFPVNSTGNIDLRSFMPGAFAGAVWYNTADGSSLNAGRHATEGNVSFRPPSGWTDAVLVLRSDRVPGDADSGTPDAGARSDGSVRPDGGASADASVGADAGPSPDASAGPDVGASDGGGADASERGAEAGSDASTEAQKLTGGCGCAIYAEARSRSSAWIPILGLMLLTVLVRRRKSWMRNQGTSSHVSANDRTTTSITRSGTGTAATRDT